MAIKDEIGKLPAADRSNDDRGTLKQFKVNLHEKDIEKLKIHFKKKGIPYTTGVRMIIVDYVNKI